MDVRHHNQMNYIVTIFDGGNQKNYKSSPFENFLRMPYLNTFLKKNCRSLPYFQTYHDSAFLKNNNNFFEYHFPKVYFFIVHYLRKGWIFGIGTMTPFFHWCYIFVEVSQIRIQSNFAIVLILWIHAHTISWVSWIGIYSPCFATSHC